MADVFLWTGLTACLLGGSVVAMTWIVWREMRRRNEVCATHPTRPPLRWLASPETSARLHRRLRDAVLALRRAVPTRRLRRRRETRIETLAAQVEAHAVSIDHELLVMARTRGPGAAEARARVARQVEEIERAAHRLAAATVRATTCGSEPTDAALRRIAEELDAREAAWNELTILERDAGLWQTV